MNLRELTTAAAILILFGSPACNISDKEWLPEATIIFTPDSGATTHTFKAEAKILNLKKGLETWYIRFDWNGDSIWDGPFSVNPVSTHRFYKPGRYPVEIEIMTQDGQHLFLTQTLSVRQGYSAPHPDFRITPTSGNFTTRFVFDASLTKDDEDSASTLKYRWDWNSDGIYDTDRSTDPIVVHSFTHPGTYEVGLEVTDPSFRYAVLSKPIIVDRTDTLIRAGFTWSSRNATVKDTFYLDASATVINSEPGRVFEYTWDILSEVTYGPFKEPVFPHVFWASGTQQVILTVRDELGLENRSSQEIYVQNENKPPAASINLSTPFGNITTQFYMDAWICKDDVTPPSELLVRWDFEGDGTWDTGWSYEKSVYHQYSEPGNYTLTLEAMDPGGERGKSTRKIGVSPYPAETSFIQDRRDNKFYGTVKIGEQWWMSDNLDYRLESKINFPRLIKCYNSSSANCDKYGTLYQTGRAQEFMALGKRVCPEGWRLPSMTDWEALKPYIPDVESRQALEIGGKTGFNAQYFGYGDFDWWIDIVSNDTVFFYNYYRFNEEVRYFSTTYNPHREAHRAQFYFGLIRNYDGVDFRWGNSEGYYYVRCIKE